MCQKRRGWYIWQQHASPETGAWQARATLQLLTMLCMLGCLPLEPQEALRTAGKSAGAIPGASPNLPYLTQISLPHSRAHVPGHCRGQVAILLLFVPGETRIPTCMDILNEEKKVSRTSTSFSLDL